MTDVSVPLAVVDRTYQPTVETAELLNEIGGVEALKYMTSIFYTRVFRNPHLNIFFHDEQDPHPDRLANWVAEKMGGVPERELQDLKSNSKLLKKIPDDDENKKKGTTSTDQDEQKLSEEEEIQQQDELTCEEQCPFVKVRGVTKGIKQCPVWIAKHPWTYEREVHRPMVDTPILVQGYGTSIEETTAIVHDRSSAHFAGWHCIKRPKEDIGDHFMLDDCRVWMRLHFWACRSAGLFYTEDYDRGNDIDGALTEVNGMASARRSNLKPLSKETQIKFEKWYTRFLGHFVRVYERQAPPFILSEVEWSTNIDRLRAYVEALGQGLHGMGDIVDVTFDLEAIGLMESLERRERIRHLRRSGWPYNADTD